MALSWADFNNGDSLLTIRNAINAFNTSVETDVNTNTSNITDNTSKLNTIPTIPTTDGTYNLSVVNGIASWVSV